MLGDLDITRKRGYSIKDFSEEKMLDLWKQIAFVVYRMFCPLAFYLLLFCKSKLC